MQPNEQLQQQLLELIYDLLSDEDATALRKRIDAEPAVAQAYAAAQETARLLSTAARLQAPPIRLAATPPHTVKVQSTGGVSGSIRGGRFTRTVHWAIGLAAAVLLAITLGGYGYHRYHLADIASEHLRLIVTGPAKLGAGATNQFTVATSTVTGSPLPTEVRYAVYSSDGTVLLAKTETTGSDGRLLMTIPPDAKFTNSARLEVLAAHHSRFEPMQVELPVDSQRFVTQLSLDKPLYQPGESVFYRSLTLGRFGLDTPQEMAVHFEIHDPSGAPVAGSQLDGVTDHGVGSGAYPLGPELAGGKYTLIARSLDGMFPEEKRSFFVRRYRLPRLKKELEFVRDSYTPGDKVVADFSANRAEGGPAAAAALRITASVDGQVVFQATPQATASGTQQIEFTLPEKIEKGDAQLSVVVDDGGTVETIAKTIPINLGKVEITFYPEGGDLVAGWENRVYFVGRNPLGEPVHIEGQIVDGKGAEVGKLETAHKGMGAFKFTPRTGETYAIKITKPADIATQPALPAVNSERHVLLSTGVGVLEAGKQIEITLATDKADRPLVATAYCRGVQVGSKPLAVDQAKRLDSGAYAYAIPLSDQASGVIRVTVFDYSSSPPKPVAERLVYRRPDRKLFVRVADHSERYSPGESVEMSLMVTDEQGQPSPAALGVAVVDDALLKMADDDTPQMTTHFYLTSEVEKPEDLEKADFYLSDDADAPASLDLLLGTQGWRRFAEKTMEDLQKEGRQNEDITRMAALDGTATPPAMFDNFDKVQQQYEADLSTYHAQQTRALGLLGRVSFVGGLVVLLCIGLLGLMRVAASVRFWLPALGTACACLVAGLVWMSSDAQPAKLAGVNKYSEFYLAYRRPESGPVTWSENQGLNRWGVNEGLEFDNDLAMPMDAAALGVIPEDRFLAENFDGRAWAFGMALGDMPAGEAIPAIDGLGREEAFFFQRMPARGWVAAGGAVRFKAGGGFGGELYAQQDLARARRLMLGRHGELRAKLRQAGGAVDDNLALYELAQQTEATIQQYRFSVREYAHQHVAAETGVRSDFAETLFWHPLLIADAQGRAAMKFQLSDSVTTFRVLADAHDGRGRLGNGAGEIISRIPFSLEPKIPLEVTAGDRIDLPVAVNNDTRGELPVALTLVTGGLLQLDGPAERNLTLAADERARQYFSLAVVGQSGTANLEVRGVAGTLADAKQQAVQIVPPGFPIAQSYAGKLAGEQQLTVRLPQDWVPGSLEVTLAAFPSQLADLQKGIDSILQEPTGCFEQASTSNYPNVLSLQYLQQNKIANPEVTRRAKELLNSGYGKLTAYECPQKGYEWFGGDPGHEALTAYGLMEFRDMAQVHDVDPTMIERTAKWLLDRRDGKGGFQRNARALDSFGGAPQEITDAYIVWALTESGQQGLDTEINHVGELAAKSDDPYLVALAAASTFNAKRDGAGKELLEKLAKLQAGDGHLDGTSGSITRSGGLSLAVETTALSALAWMKSPAFHQQAQKAIDWINKSRQGAGGFGSTQATILALKALVAQAQENRKAITAGELVIKRDGQVLSQQAFGAGHENTISLAGFAGKLEPGDNRLTISLSGDNQMPYALDVSYRARTPASHDDCPLRLTTTLAQPRIKAGDTVSLAAELVNTTDKGQPMTVAILGLPAGLQPRADQLEALRKAGTIDYYETRAREVVCYWRSLAPEKKVQWKLDLVGEWPGQYTGPASRTYLYYTAEQKQWVEPLAIEITRD